MRILFVNANLRPGHPTRYLPVGIGYVMTVVHQAGYEFDLLDIGLHDYDDQYVEDFLADNRYDVVLSGSIVTHYKWMKWLTRAVKKHQPECTVIIGNSVAGSIPDLFLRNSAADVVIVGEGEYATLDTLNCLRDGGDLGDVAGIVFRAPNGEFIHTARRKAILNIDDIPLIDWDLFEVNEYFAITDTASAGAMGVDLREGEVCRAMPVSTARGCVFKCTFCHIVYMHDPYRHRSAANVLKEARRNLEHYGANYINFWDDLSFYKLTQAEAFVDEILSSDLSFPWNAAIRSDLFGKTEIPYARRREVAEKFKEAGCLSVGYSLESGNPEILEMMEKRVKLEYFQEQVELLREVGITSNTSIVFGYPIETRDTMRQTFDHCERNRIYPSVGFLLPLPDTGMYDYARQNGFIPDEDAYLDSITERQDICLNITQMSDQEIMEEIKRGCGRLNEMLELGLSEERYIRTGGYRKHTARQENKGRVKRLRTVDASAPVDLENLQRNENDVSFNYAKQIFDLNE